MTTETIKRHPKNPEDCVDAIRALSWLLYHWHEGGDHLNVREAGGVHTLFELISDDLEAALCAESDGQAAQEERPETFGEYFRRGVPYHALTTFGSRKAYEKAMADSKSELDAVARDTNLKPETVRRVIEALQRKTQSDEPAAEQAAS